MSTPYSPNGQVTPVGEYILPQDVIDLVVAESVNNPFVVGADNVAWLMLLLFFAKNPKNFGAVGDGVASDQPAFTDMFDASESGAWYFIPPGTYRVTGNFVPPGGTVWVGLPGRSRIVLDHATNNFFTLANNDSMRFVDLQIEGMQTNTGTVFRAVGSGARVTLERCKVNQDHYLIGTLLNSTIQKATLGDCDVDSRVTGATLAMSAKVLEISGGEYEMAPGATTPMLGGADSSSRVKVIGAYFEQDSVLGDVAFISCNCDVTATSNTFNADSDDAESATYGFDLVGGLVHTSDNSFTNDTLLYRGYNTAARSDLQLLPYMLVESGAPALTLANYRRVYEVELSNTSPPTITQPRILFLGQRLTMCIKNATVGAWSGAFVIASQDSILDAGAAEFSDLLAGRVCVVEFVATTNLGDKCWMQAGASVQVPP